MGHLAAAGASYLGEAFVFTIEITTPGDSFYPGFISIGIYNCNVDWGDGSNDDITSYNQTEATHTYINSGTYNVTITGSVSNYDLLTDGNTHRDKYRSLISWGDPGILSSCFYAFYNCTGLTSIPNEPIPSHITDAQAVFVGCSSLTTVPAVLLDEVTISCDVQSLLRNSGVTVIPDDFGRGCLSSSVKQVFQDCTDLLSIGNSVFRDCPNIDGSVTMGAHCTAATIGTDFMRDCTITGSKSARLGFSLCPNLASVGSGFMQDSGVKDVSSLFDRCGNLLSIPALIGLDPAPNFDDTFSDCTSATNTVQELWNDYPSATSHLFTYRFATNLANYASIPAGWK